MLTRYRMEMATAAVVFLLGAIAVIGAMELDYGWAEDGPQAGYFPFRIGLIVMAAAVAIAVQGWYNRTALTREVFVDRAGGGGVLRFGLSILALVVLSLTLGMYVAMAAYLIIMMRWQGRHSWLASIAVPLLYTLATWLVFERWFLVPLLKGPVEVWLGLA